MYGMLITVVTAVVMPTQVIWFGILNFMGCAAIITFLFYKQMKKIPALLGMMINLLLFFSSRDIMVHKFGIEHLLQIHIPDFFYHIKILTFFGFPYEEFYSSDYFPVFPWIFLFLTGYFLHRYWTDKNGKHIDIHQSIPLLTWIGQKSIKIYLLHQPLCFALCSLIFAQIRWIITNWHMKKRKYNVLIYSDQKHFILKNLNSRRVLNFQECLYNLSVFPYDAVLAVRRMIRKKIVRLILFILERRW